MKATTKLAFAAIASLMFALPNVAKADPAEAEIDGYRIGRSLIGSLYQLRLVESGIAPAGNLLIVRFDVQAGVDYCLVTGRDVHVADINLMVYDQNGTLIREDVTGQSRGAVRWRSSYTGTATAYVHMVRTNGIRPGSYAAFLGMLVMPRTGKAAPENVIAP
jgi:hypothetical protein